MPDIAMADSSDEIFPDNSITTYEEELGSGEEFTFTEDSQSPMFESEEDLSVGEIEIPDGAESFTTVDDADINVGEEIFFDNSDSFNNTEEELGDTWPEENELEFGEDSEQISEEGAVLGEEDLGGSGPSILFSTSALSINRGATANVTVSYTGTSETIYLSYALGDSSICSASWGGWSNNKIPIHITGKKMGSTYVYIYMRRASDQRIIASARFYVEVADNAKISASVSSVSVYQGNAKSVQFSYSGFSGIVYMQYRSTNSAAYTCGWGGWSNNKISLTIKGNSVGSGKVIVYLKSATTGNTLASTTVNVSVSAAARLALSTSYVTINQGGSTQVRVTYSNYSGTVYMQYGTTNSSAFSAKWGNWSGTTCPLTITGNRSGSGTIYIYLKDSSTNQTLATTSFTVQIMDSPKVTPSNTRITVKSGEAANVNMTVSGIDYCFLRYAVGSEYYASCSWGSWSGNSIPLKITGKNVGTTTIKIELLNSSKTVVASTSISVSVEKARIPYLKTSTSSVDLRAGNALAVSVSFYDTSDVIYLQYGTTNNTAYSCSWGSWIGNTIPLTITGRSAGEGIVTVYLKRSSDHAELAKLQIKVTVSGNSGNLKNLSYQFENFAQAASKNLCEYMFGNTSYADYVYNVKVGQGGNCFGMASTAGMFYTSGNGINPSAFNSSKSAISELVRTDRNTNWGLSVEQYVMAMQLAQLSPQYKPTRISESELGRLVQTILLHVLTKRPVMVSVFGQYKGNNCGHAVLAYGVENVTSTQQRLLIYDSNYPFETRYLYLNKNSSGVYTSWSYQIFKDGTTWGTGKANASISFTTYNDFSGLWSNRGKLDSKSTNLLFSNSKNLTLYDVYGNVVATVINGELYTEDENIREVSVTSVMESMELVGDCLLYLPVKLYTVKNNDEAIGEFEIDLVNVELGTRVITTADEITLCADDECNIASALIVDSKDEKYEIILNSSREGEPESITLSGIASDDTVSAMMNDGQLDSCNLESAELTIGETNAEDNEKFIISVECGSNGQIVCDESNVVETGDNRTYSILPDSGYEVEEVIADGISKGAVSTYTFEDIRENHTLKATFREKITSYLLGDVNGDNQVDAKDLTTLARHVAKIELITESDFLMRADTNQDGVVDAADLTHLARYVAKIITEM